MSSQEDFQFFIEATGITDKQEIQDRIRANNNDITAAIGDYFEGSTKYETAKNNTAWDETAFSLDREGEAHRPAATSFCIDSMDNGPIHGPSVAPSRPPSRANTRTPVSNGASGNVEAWRQSILPNPREASEVAGHNFPMNAEEEDADMKRALAASMADAGMAVPDQETGVVSVNEVHFGPATRPAGEYDTGQWDIVPADRDAFQGPVGSNSTAVYEEAASSRIRQLGAPAFLLSANREKMPQLASAITILHEIPAARNALLRTGHPATKYYHNPLWWRGNSVEYPSGDEPQGGLQEMAEEIHRLMAFLDGTERSYGCVDPLLRTKPLQSEYDPLPAFTTTVLDAIDPQYRSILFTDFTRQFRATPPSWEGEGNGAEGIALVGLRPGNYLGDGFPPIMCLYDILNMVMWHQFILPPAEPDDALACIRNPSEVIVFRWEGEGITNDIEVPEMICIDRYLESNTHVALSIQKGIAAAADRLAALKKLRPEIFDEALPNGKVVPRAEHLRAMIERCKVKLSSIDEDAAWRAADARWKASRTRNSDVDLLEETSDPDFQKARLTEDEQRKKKIWANELEAFQSSLERCERAMKVYGAMELFYEGLHGLVTDRCVDSTLDQQRALLGSIKKQLCSAIGSKDAEKAFAHFDLLYPGVLDVDNWGDPDPVCKRYLRGVATSDNIIYVCTKPDPLSCPEGGINDKWWKLEYREDEAEPVRASVVDETTVRVAAGKTKDKPLLVYASENAIRQEPELLPPSLSFFIKSDNRIFQNEVSNESPEVVLQQQLSSSAPSKRKFRSCSIDSDATNRASYGGNSDDMNPFTSSDDLAADQELVHSSHATPLNASSSTAVENDYRLTGGTAIAGSSAGARRRKAGRSSSHQDARNIDNIAESSHIEYRDSNLPPHSPIIDQQHEQQEEQLSQPLSLPSLPAREMQSKELMPLIGMRGDGNNSSSVINKNLAEQTTAGVDIMNMDVHEHID